MQQGATWDRTMTSKFGYNENVCELCGIPDAQITHTCWHCPALKQQHEKLISEVCPNLQVDLLPVAMLHGIAPAMAEPPNHSYWGCKLEISDIKTKRVLGCRRVSTVTCDAKIKKHKIAAGAEHLIKQTCDEIVTQAVPEDGAHITAAQIIAHLRHNPNDLNKITKCN